MRNHLRAASCLLCLAVLCLTALSMYAVSQEPASSSTASTSAEGRKYCEDWTKPAFAFFITGRQHGYIEPCGCTGLANQKGGLARRQTLYRELLARGWDMVPVDVGNQVRRFGPQAAIKFQTTMTSLKKMEYEAVGLGPDDLRLDSGELAVEIAGGEPTPLLCSNVSILGFPVSDGYKIVQAGKYKVGIAAVIGESEQRGIRSDDIEFTKPAAAIVAAHRKFVKAKCDVMLLLAHASTEETIRIATSSAEAKDFRLVVTAGGADEPALEPQKIEGTSSFLIQTGKKGMYVGVLGIYPGTDKPIRYERIPLDKRFVDSKEMLKSLATYQDRLKDMYKADWTRLVLQPVAHPTARQFVGSEACKDCHETAFDIWQKTPHHEATHNIAFPTERSSIPRHYDPECLSCHVTGWDPQNYFPYVSGYRDFEKSRHLHGNGCENCHGPGSAHVAAENGDVDATDEQIESLRTAMQLPLDRAQERCLKCHDLDNDPDFQKEGAFEAYWDKIKHYE